MVRAIHIDTTNRDLAGRRVVVTGANGFVGRATCRRLLAAGADVWGCVRRADAIGGLPAGVRASVVRDVHDTAAWSDVIRDADAVVHLIARTHMTDDGPGALPEYRRTNVEITRALLAAAIERRVPRFVFTSSIKAVGEGASHAYDETTPCNPADPYGVTKREAELLVHGECWGTETTATVVRPPLVYGPGVGGNLARLIRAVDRGMPLPLGRIGSRRSLIHVDNLADALVRVAAHPHAAGRTLHVADDGSPPTVRELVERIAHHLGRSARLLPVPSTMLRVAGRLLRKSSEVERLVGSLVISTRVIRSRLGWAPPVDAEEGLRETVEWYQRTAIARAA